MSKTRISRTAKVAGTSAAILGLTFGGAATAVWAQSDSAPAAEATASDQTATPTEKVMVIESDRRSGTAPAMIVASGGKVIGTSEAHIAVSAFGGDEAWAPFEECISTAIGDEPSDAEFESMTDAEIDALEAGFEAAESDCEALLPEALQVEMAAFDEFETCLDENLGGMGPMGGAEDGDMVFVEAGDVEEFLVLNGEGSVTISRDAAGAVTVDKSGAVESIDETEMEEAFEAAHEACGDLLPEGMQEVFGGALMDHEGLFFDHDMDIEFFDLDDDEDDSDSDG